MARALLICYRHPVDTACVEHRIAVLNARLTPDNLTPQVPLIAHAGGVAAALLAAPAGAGGGAEAAGAGTWSSGAGAAELRGVSLRLGAVAGDNARDWWRPGSGSPDGSFALLRADADSIELVADGAASRTIWYAWTEDVFIASSSQRAIIAMLGSFEPNHYAPAWMLSSATLGPGNAWDKRLTAVPPGGRITLDRRRWRLAVRPGAAPLAPLTLSPDEHRRRLEEAVELAVAQLEHEPSKWLLPLSGGIDSRGLLLAYLRAGVPPSSLTCVTWGRRAALEEPDSDAFVARQLAERYGVEHRYLETDVSHEDPDTIIDRFLVAGEGRIGHISGYLDGFELWRKFRVNAVHGVIRGDHTFGGSPVRTRSEALHNAGLVTLEDHFPDDVLKWFDTPAQALPRLLAQRPGEPLGDWRDRLRQQFRLPAVLAALTDLKTPYVEVLNPLLCMPIIECNRRLPTGLRTGKQLWRDIVNTWAPGVGQARSPATVPVQSFLNDDTMLRRMHDELASAPAADSLGPGTSRALRSFVGCRLDERRSTRSVPVRAASATARKLGSAARRLRRMPPRIDPVVVAFRGILVSRMHTLLAEDAALFAEEHYSRYRKLSM